MLELQAPQGPYTNVLDLQVFPAMSKRHSELLQVHSNSEADKCSRTARPGSGAQKYNRIDVENRNER